MQGTMLVLTTDGERISESLDKPPELDVLRKHVDGPIELVPYFDTYKDDDKIVRSCVVYCNEEGKLRRLPINAEANGLWTTSQVLSGIELDDALVGNIIILYGDDEFMRAL